MSSKNNCIGSHFSSSISESQVFDSELILIKYFFLKACNSSLLKSTTFWPFVSLVVINDPENITNNKYYCAGSIINKTTVLTSVSCFNNYINKKNLNAQSFVDNFSLSSFLDQKFSIKILVPKNKNSNTNKIKISEMIEFDVEDMQPVRDILYI